MYKYMFSKQDRPEKDDFEINFLGEMYRKNGFQYFKKILGKIFKYLTDTLK